ncbi:hypothetical protein [Phenylobacterium sp.]|uniref:hypothetical protein n=1 Tax=Phenylobacterium sp. TaxID=1871053 RepID=UPI0025CECD87|nr:hypothetical protein [Phenylobacterium sp.]
MPDPKLSEAEFRARYLEQFADPAFRALDAELERIAAVAWDAYSNHRKAPTTRKAGPEFADPAYDLSVDWLAAREAVLEAQARHEDKAGPKRFLIIAERGRRREARLAGVNVAPVLGGQARQVQHLDVGVVRRLEDIQRHFREAPGFGHLAGTGVFAA